MSRVAVMVDARDRSILALPVLPAFFDDALGEQPPCRPFGVTWDADHVYIANNRQLLVYDRDLEFARIDSVSLQGNIHQLAWHKGTIWAASPWTNSLIGVRVDGGAAIEFDPFLSKITPYDERPANSLGDLKHVNSLLWTSERLYVAIHNFGHSLIAEYDLPTLALNKVHRNPGNGIHGLAYEEGRLFTVSTNSHEVRATDGECWPLPRNGFARGFAMTRDHFIVGISETASREARSRGNAWIQIIDRAPGRVEGEIELHNTGCINDLRILDQNDFAHGVIPFAIQSAEHVQKAGKQ